MIDRTRHVHRPRRNTTTHDTARSFCFMLWRSLMKTKSGFIKLCISRAFARCCMILLVQKLLRFPFIYPVCGARFVVCILSLLVVCVYIYTCIRRLTVRDESPLRDRRTNTLSENRYTSLLLLSSFHNFAWMCWTKTKPRVRHVKKCDRRELDPFMFKVNLNH